eukprot:1733827-Pyramimonas_sp.AAC.1
MEVEWELECVGFLDEAYDGTDSDGDNDPRDQSQASHTVALRLARPAVDGEILVLIWEDMLEGDSGIWAYNYL